MRAVKVIPEYGCYPLWTNDKDELANNVSPETLPISKKLAEEFCLWADSYESTLDKKYPPDSGFNSKDDELKFITKGYELALALKGELFNIKVTYCDIAKKCEISI